MSTVGHTYTIKSELTPCACHSHPILGMTSESDDLAEFHEAFEFTGVPAVETSIKDRKAKSMPLKLPPAYPLSASQSTVKQNKRTLTPSGDTTRTCRLNLRMSDDKSFSYFPTSKVAPHSHSFTSFHARGNVAHSRDLVYAVPTEFPTDSCLQSRRSERMSIGVGAKSPYACESGFSGSRTDAFAMLPFTTFVDNRDNAFSPTTFRNGLLPRKRASNASAFTNGRTAEETRVGVSLESVVNNQSHSIYHKPKQTKSTTAKKVGTPEIDGDTIGADDTKSLAGNRRLEKERRPISRQSTVIETTQPTCLSLTPTFLACLDDFVEFVQPSFSSLEDTLDEIHLQMSKVFKNSKISLYNDADYMKMPLACSSTSTSFFSAPHDGGSELIVDIPTVDLQFVQSFTLDSSSDEVLVSTTLKTQGLRVMKTKDIPIAPIGTPLVAFRDQPSKDTVVTLDSFLIFSHVAESYPVARQRNQEGCITLSSVHPETCQAILESHVDSNDCDGIFFIFHVQNSVLSTTEKVDVKPLQKARTRRKDAEAPDLSSQFSASRSRMPRAFVAAQPHSLVDHHGGFDGSGISRLLQHGFRAQIDDASLYVGSSAPSLVYAVIDDWALSVDKSEFVKGIRTMSQGPTEWLENMYGPQETNAFKHMSHNENHFNLTKLVGGPSSTSSRFRWQAALSFALQNYGTHVLHNHPNRRNKSRNPGRLFSSIDQMRLLMWFNARSPDSRVGKRLQDEGRRIKKAFKNSGRAGAKPKMQAPLTQEAVSNYVRSTCAPLTIALRKLLNLPEEIRSRLQFRLQQHEAPQMLNYQDIFHHSSARLSLVGSCLL